MESMLIGSFPKPLPFPVVAEVSASKSGVNHSQLIHAHMICCMLTIYSLTIKTEKKVACLLEDIMLEMDRIRRPQGTIIIRDEDSIISRIRTIAPKFLWDVESHLLENEQKTPEPVLICRKKFWAII